MEQKQAVHWADIAAEKIIREKGEKEQYVCASGITPSGTVHIGNFREIISVELVVRALRERGKKVRFIYSWDDYDVFRKVPKNMPRQEVLAAHLRFPITLVPDPFDRDESYARHHEVDVEVVLPLVGIEPEYLYQAQRYRSSVYAEGMKKALQGRARIKAILDEFRSEDLGEDWWPISVFCDACNKDTTKIEAWDGDYLVDYSCECGHREKVDMRTARGVKLFWRVDWPMRWAHEGVDFEPAGKDHHSQGGSFDTAKTVVRDIYGREPPVTFQYDFIGIKGRGGKISSSTGDVIDLNDVLEVYTPEIARYMFAGTRPNTEFCISFDLDVIKIYEDYDRTERIYFGKEECAEDKRAKEARIYELSQVKAVPAAMPYQAAFRHLCNSLQVYSLDIARTIAAIEAEEGIALGAEDRARLEVRAKCASNWIRDFAPEEFKFALRSDGSAPELSDAEAKAVRALRALLEGGLPAEKELGDRLRAIAQENGIEGKAFFQACYRALIGKDQGPRLASFIHIIGREKAVEILGAV